VAEDVEEAERGRSGESDGDAARRPLDSPVHRRRRVRGGIGHWVNVWTALVTG
jgi:hypothetical protein